MPMWISWENPKKGKRERIYNYQDPDTPEGRRAIRMARACLAIRFGVLPCQVTGFLVEPAPWISPFQREQMEAKA